MTYPRDGIGAGGSTHLPLPKAYINRCSRKTIKSLTRNHRMKYSESDITLVSFSSSGKSHWSNQIVTMTLTETLEMILENDSLQIVKDPIPISF
jgi:hypothetical protein